MPLEEEMRNEMYKLENEIDIIDMELEKLYAKISHFMGIRKKKEHDLRILRQSFGQASEETDYQTTLARLLKEKI